jgi:hypothetical protein
MKRGCRGFESGAAKWKRSTSLLFSFFFVFAMGKENGCIFPRWLRPPCSSQAPLFSSPSPGERSCAVVQVENRGRKDSQRLARGITTAVFSLFIARRRSLSLSLFRRSLSLSLSACSLPSFFLSLSFFLQLSPFEFWPPLNSLQPLLPFHHKYKTKTGVQVGNACWELYCLEHG